MKTAQNPTVKGIDTDFHCLRGLATSVDKNTNILRKNWEMFRDSLGRDPVSRAKVLGKLTDDRAAAKYEVSISQRGSQGPRRTTLWGIEASEGANPHNTMAMLGMLAWVAEGEQGPIRRVWGKGEIVFTNDMPDSVGAAGPVMEIVVKPS